MGVLDIESNQPDAFDKEDILLAESLAEAVALALDNARLYAETRQRLKEQTALHRAGQIISATLDPTRVLSHIAEQMGQAIEATSAYIGGYEAATLTTTILAEYISSQASAQERTSEAETLQRQGSAEKTSLRPPLPPVAHED